MEYIIFQILISLCWGMLYHIYHNQDYAICRIRETGGFPMFPCRICGIWNKEYILFFQILMSLCLICYIIYIKIWNMWDQTKGWVPMKKSSCAHLLTRCSYVHSDPQNQLFWWHCISHNPYPI